jgi:hypothetical protein
MKADVTVDGARGRLNLDLIKGCWVLLRERIVADCSRMEIILVARKAGGPSRRARDCTRRGLFARRSVRDI